MKRAAGSYQTERSGFHAIAKIVHEELRWIFQPQEQDFGIDALIEVIAVEVELASFTPALLAKAFRGEL